MIPVSVAGVLRNTGAGWKLLEDEAHEALNLARVVDMGTYLRLDYGRSFLKVGALVVAPDETFAQEGVRAGASVGLMYSNIWMYRADGQMVVPAGLTSRTGNWFVHGTMWSAA